VTGVQTCALPIYELQKICQLGNTELCLALVQLIQENKIKQDRNEQGIYYVLNG